MVQAAESVITVMNKALEPTLFHHACFSVLQVGTYIQMMDSSKTMWIKREASACQLDGYFML